MSREELAGGLRTSHVKEVQEEGAGATPESPRRMTEARVKKKVATLELDEYGRPHWTLQRISQVRISQNIIFMLEENWNVAPSQIAKDDPDLPELISELEKDVEALLKRNYDVKAVAGLYIVEK